MTSYSWNITLKCQLVIIGDSGVGKTNLMTRYTDDDFSPNRVSNIGLEFRQINLEIEGKKVEVEIWDTAGQEKFDSILPSFLRDIDGVILVYDITKFSSISRINYWLKVVEKETRKKSVKKILVGNKCDLHENREVLKKEGEKIARLNQMFFYETSAKNNTNIDDAFLYIINEIVDTKMDEVLPQNFENSPKLESTKSKKKSCQC